MWIKYIYIILGFLKIDDSHSKLFRQTHLVLHHSCICTTLQTNFVQQPLNSSSQLVRHVLKVWVRDTGTGTSIEPSTWSSY